MRERISPSVIRRASYSKARNENPTSLIALSIDMHVSQSGRAGFELAVVYFGAPNAGHSAVGPSASAQVRFPASASFCNSVFFYFFSIFPLLSTPTTSEMNSRPGNKANNQSCKFSFGNLDHQRQFSYGFPGGYEIRTKTILSHLPPSSQHFPSISAPNSLPNPPN